MEAIDKFMAEEELTEQELVRYLLLISDKYKQELLHDFTCAIDKGIYDEAIEYDEMSELTPESRGYLSNEWDKLEEEAGL